MSRLPTTRPVLLLRFPLSDTLLVPDRTHSKLAVGARYATEVPPGEVSKHRIPLEAQSPAQSRGVQNFVVLWYLYPVKICLLHHERHHTEIIDTLGDNINRLLTSGRPPRTQGEDAERPPRVVCSRTVQGRYLSRCANQRGDKSAKRVLRGLLALLALPHIRNLESCTPRQ